MFHHLSTVLAILVLLATPAAAQKMDHDHHNHPQIGDLVIHHPYIPAPPGLVGTAAAYLGITNDGDAPDRLIAVSSPASGKVMIHRTIIENDIARMRHAMNGIELPAGDRVELEPGGYHIMLMKLTDPLTEGDMVELTLTFEAAGDITFTVPVVATGMSHGMDHDHDGGTAAE